MPEGDYAIQAEYDGYLSGVEPATTAGATYSLVIEMVDEDTIMSSRKGLQPLLITLQYLIQKSNLGASGKMIVMNSHTTLN